MTGLGVLLVEDNVINQMLGKFVLEKMGCTIDLASDGREAERVLSEKKYDLILMDLHLPFQDGIQVTKKIKQEYSINRETPVIAVTASGDQNDILRCFQAGMIASVSKPIKESEVQPVIDKLLLIK